MVSQPIRRRLCHDRRFLGRPAYQFSNYGTCPGSYSSGRLGFRCVRNAPGVTGDQGAMPLDTVAAVPVYKPAGEASSACGKNSITATRSRHLTRRSLKSKRLKTGGERKSPTSVRKVSALDSQPLPERSLKDFLASLVLEVGQENCVLASLVSLK